MQNSRQTLAAILFALSLAPLVALPAASHEAEKGPNGGPMVSVEDKHVELVSNGADIAVYITDAGHQPLPAAGASGRAVIQAEGKTGTVALQPGEGNRLVGKAETPITPGARVVVSASLASGKSLQARFVVK